MDTQLLEKTARELVAQQVKEFLQRMKVMALCQIDLKQ